MFLQIRGISDFRDLTICEISIEGRWTLEGYFRIFTDKVFLQIRGDSIFAIIGNAKCPGQGARAVSESR